MAKKSGPISAFIHTTVLVVVPWLVCFMIVAKSFKQAQLIGIIHWLWN